MAPLIAVAGRLLAAGRVDRWRHDGVGVPRLYLDALHRAGGQEAVMLPVPISRDDARALLARFDGLLLTGGGDIDPAHYGAEPHTEVYGVQPDSDTFELALTCAAIDEGVPVLGLCRGMQVLNVACGGTLDQHVTGRPGVGNHGYPGVDASPVPVHVAAGSRLASALGGTSATAVCHHHQAVDRLGDGLTAVAWADDGLVEGIELDRGWVVGVQWHPEDSAADDPMQQSLFDEFVRRAGG